MAWKLLSVARETNCLPEADLAQLDEIRAAMEEHRRGGLTEKNLNVIRAVLTGQVWDEVVQLPRALMAEARLLRHQAPVKAAVTAQLATAIAILTFDPVRLGNLIQIRLDENLIKPGKLDDPYWLVFPHYDVKNRVRLEAELVPQVCEIIDEYIHDYRSVLLRGSNAPWLFPGETGGVKTSRTLVCKSPPASKKRADCESPFISSGMPQPRSTSKNILANGKPYDSSLGTVISRPRSTFTPGSI